MDAFYLTNLVNVPSHFQTVLKKVQSKLSESSKMLSGDRETPDFEMHDRLSCRSFPFNRVLKHLSALFVHTSGHFMVKTDLHVECHLISSS